MKSVGDQSVRGRRGWYTNIIIHCDHDEMHWTRHVPTSAFQEDNAKMGTQNSPANTMIALLTYGTYRRRQIRVFVRYIPVQLTMQRTLSESSQSKRHERSALLDGQRSYSSSPNQQPPPNENPFDRGVRTVMPQNRDYSISFSGAFSLRWEQW